MKHVFLAISLCLAACAPAVPQIVNANNAANPYKLIGTANAIKPQPCNPQTGDLAFATDAVAGENLYVCTSTGTWTIVGIDGAQVLSGTISSARIPGGLAVSSLSDSNANVALGVTAVTAGAINNFAIRAAATTAPPQFTIATTTDANVGMTFAPKGTGAFKVTQSTNTNPSASFVGVASAINGFLFTPAAAGSQPSIGIGTTTDSVVDINVTPKGSGALLLNPQATYTVAQQGITDAALATGVVLVPPVTGHTVRVVHAGLVPHGGTVAACTNIGIGTDTFTNPTIVYLVAGTLVDAVMVSETSSVAMKTMNTAPVFGAQFAANAGIGIQSTGSTCTTATTFDVIVQYQVNY